MSSPQRNVAKLRIATLLILVCCFATIWFSALQNRSRIRLNDEQTAHAEIIKLIPLGSDVRQAADILRRSGFNLQLKVAGKYQFDLNKTNIFSRVEKSYQSPQLSAYLFERNWFGLRTAHWEIKLNYKKLRVTLIEVERIPIGYNL